MITELAERIRALSRDRPTLVAIDGEAGVGKTSVASSLAAACEQAGRPVVRICVDDFCNPRAIRYRLGRESPEGYYRDTTDVAALIEKVLAPLGPGGSRRYYARSFDLEADAPTQAEALTAPDDAIVIVEGLFLLRPDLRRYWDYTVFLEAAPGVAAGRAVARDGAAARRLYEVRYGPGQALYCSEVNPRASADCVLDVTDLEQPRFVARSQDS